MIYLQMLMLLPAQVVVVAGNGATFAFYYFLISLPFTGFQLILTGFYFLSCYPCLASL